MTRSTLQGQTPGGGSREYLRVLVWRRRHRRPIASNSCRTGRSRCNATLIIKKRGKHLLPLNNPALVSAPYQSSFSGIRCTILTCTSKVSVAPLSHSIFHRAIWMAQASNCWARTARGCSPWRPASENPGSRRQPRHQRNWLERSSSDLLNVLSPGSIVCRMSTMRSKLWSLITPSSDTSPGTTFE